MEAVKTTWRAANSARDPNQQLLCKCAGGSQCAAESSIVPKSDNTRCPSSIVDRSSQFHSRIANNSRNIQATPNSPSQNSPSWTIQTVSTSSSLRIIIQITSATMERGI